MKLWSKLAAFAVLACFTTAYAQGTVCTDMVKQALATVQTACAPTGRNQACYGNVSLSAIPQTGVQGFSFQKQGDLVNVADIASLELQQLDLKKQIWGVALLKLQANLPDTLPGQNVTFLLFGDVKLTNAVTPTSGTGTPSATTAPLNPMQAFYFSTGIGKSSCSAAPADGILIQTPKGQGKISLRANNVDVQLGSTAFLRAQPDGKMTVSVVEGEGILTANGKSVTVPAGKQASIPLDADLQADGAPEQPEPYDASDVAELPIDLLPLDIAIAPPDESDTADVSANDAGDTSDQVGDNSDVGDTSDVGANEGDSVESDNSAQDSVDTSQQDTSSSDSNDHSGESDGGGD